MHHIQSALVAVAHRGFEALVLVFVDIPRFGLPFPHPQGVSGIALMSARTPQVGDFSEGIRSQVVVDFPEQVGAFHIDILLFQGLGYTGFYIKLLGFIERVAASGA